ncbi:MAG: tRNA lysidine(34) synthetase TilS [Devosiaceae bacterium]|nr:tRNA lysidine(34) synthetase TilS [Devosiaceae bacterium]
MLKHGQTSDLEDKMSEKADELLAPMLDENAIALAVSGGVDSLALMILVRSWLDNKQNNKLRPKIFIYSVDHGLRSQSAVECQGVKTLATGFGFEHKTLIWQGKKPTTGVQAAARMARYRLIGEQMALDGVGYLLSGHHMDDQAETIMMRLAHGSGLSGLKGMELFSEIFGMKIFRPLLGMGREELNDIVEQAGLDAFNDPSNHDLKYERVRWRKLLSDIKETGLTGANLNRFALRMGRADRALDHFCSAQYKSCVKQDQFGVQMISHEQLIAQPEEIAIRLLGKMIYCGSGGRNSGELSQLEDLIKNLSNPQFNGMVIGGCGIALKHGKVVVFREAGRLAAGRLAVDLLAVDQLATGWLETNKTLLQPGQKTLWDQRFVVENLSKNPVIVQGAFSLSRQQLQDHVAGTDQIKMDWVHSCVMVVDEAGNLLAIGANSFSEVIICELVDFD